MKKRRNFATVAIIAGILLLTAIVFAYTAKEQKKAAKLQREYEQAIERVIE